MYIHWLQGDIMVPTFPFSLYTPGARISEISMAYLKDTGGAGIAGVGRGHYELAGFQYWLLVLRPQLSPKLQDTRISAQQPLFFFCRKARLRAWDLDTPIA